MQGPAVELAEETEGERGNGHLWRFHPFPELVPEQSCLPLRHAEPFPLGLVSHKQKSPVVPAELLSGPPSLYLVVGIGVPSVRQVLVNQGLLVLSGCLQECVQAHGLGLGLGLGLGKLRTRANQLHTVGCRDLHTLLAHTNEF